MRKDGIKYARKEEARISCISPLDSLCTLKRLRLPDCGRASCMTCSSALCFCNCFSCSETSTVYMRPFLLTPMFMTISPVVWTT